MTRQRDRLQVGVSGTGSRCGRRADETRSPKKYPSKAKDTEFVFWVGRGHAPNAVRHYQPAINASPRENAPANRVKSSPLLIHGRAQRPSAGGHPSRRCAAGRPFRCGKCARGPRKTLAWVGRRERDVCRDTECGRQPRGKPLWQEASLLPTPGSVLTRMVVGTPPSFQAPRRLPRAAEPHNVTRQQSFACICELLV